MQRSTFRASWQLTPQKTTRKFSLDRALDKRVKIGCPTEKEIDRIGEIKASRDILVHNRGIVNKIYLAKAGDFARFADGQKLDIPEHYHREAWELIRKVISEVFAAAAEKAD